MCDILACRCTQSVSSDTNKNKVYGAVDVGDFLLAPRQVLVIKIVKDRRPAAHRSIFQRPTQPFPQSGQNTALGSNNREKLSLSLTLTETIEHALRSARRSLVRSRAFPSTTPNARPPHRPRRLLVLLWCARRRHRRAEGAPSRNCRSRDFAPHLSVAAPA